MTESCTTCRFAHSIPWSSETGAGVDHFCRFDPPEFVPPNSASLKPTKADGWCGKHEKAAVPAPGNAPNTKRSPKLSLQEEIRRAMKTKV